jgi:hypothetical protein
MEYSHANFPEAERPGAIRPIYEVFHRYFASEKIWQLLRYVKGSTAIYFETTSMIFI